MTVALISPPKIQTYVVLQDNRNVEAPFRAGIDIEDYQLDPEGMPDNHALDAR
jgi:hypothetical protein